MAESPVFKPAFKPATCSTKEPDYLMPSGGSSSKLAAEMSDDDGNGADWAGEDDDLSLSD